MTRTFLLSVALALFAAPMARAFEECRFAFEIDTQTSAYHSLVEQAQARGGFWRPISEAPDDVQDIAKYIGRLDVCLRTADGKPRTLSRGDRSIELKSPYVATCTAALLPGNRLLTNWHCFYEPGLASAGFTIVDQVRVNFGYTSKDLTQTVKTFLVANREMQKNEDFDALVLQVVGGDANEVVGGSIPMLMETAATPRRALTMIHHPFGDPQQFSAGTCQIDSRQSEVPEELSLLRHRCESAGGSSGSLLLDARTLAVVGLHNTGGLGTSNDYNGGHKIAMINDAMQLGFEPVGLTTTTPPQADPANTALIEALVEADFDRRRDLLKEIVRRFPGTPAAISAANTLEIMEASVAATTTTVKPPEAPPVVVVTPSEEEEPDTESGNVLTVRADGSGDYRTIAEAIAAAPANAKIEVHPGRYRGGADVDKPLQIVGVGDRGDIVWEARDDDVIYWTAASGRIANLTLRQTGGDFYGIDFDGGSAVVEDCDLSSQGLAALAIHAGANPTVRNSLVHDGADAGIFVFDGGRGQIIGNDIYGNAKSSVAIGDGANPLLRDNTIRGGGQSGVFVYADATGTVEGNEISDHALSNIVIASGANPRILGNSISDSERFGIRVYQNGKGLIDGNDITENKQAGVYVQSGGDPMVRGNRIHHGGEGGVFIDGGGVGSVIDNEIFANTLAGIEIANGGDPTVRDNRIYDGAEVGIFLYSNGRGLIEGNEIYNNALSGIEIKSGADPVVRRNVIRNGKQGGIFVQEDGLGTIENNEIYGNGLSGVEIRAGSDPVVRNNVIRDGKQGGVYVREKGRGTIENNEIYGNALSGVEIRSEGDPLLRGNEIRNNSDAGVFLNENAKGRIENNRIIDNGLAGVEVRSDSNPTIIGNTISGNTYEAIWIYEGAGATIRDNDLRGNAKGAFRIEANAGKVTRSNNRE